MHSTTYVLERIAFQELDALVRTKLRTILCKTGLLTVTEVYLLISTMPKELPTPSMSCGWQPLPRQGAPSSAKRDT